MRRISLFLTSVVLLGIFTAQTVVADDVSDDAQTVSGSPVEQQTIEIEPKFIETQTPSYRAYEADFQPHYGTYTYQVSWNGIPAAEAKLVVDGDAFRYHVAATARTYSAIDIFYKLRYRAEGTISALDMSPINTTMIQQENRKSKEYSINFFPDGRVESIRTQSGKPTELIRFSSSNATLDPFSAAFLARTLDWEEGQTRRFDTFNGKTRYLISFTATGKEIIRYNGEDRECWVIVPGVTKMVDGQPQDKLKSAKIYMTTDANREVLKIVSSVFIGSVTTKLINFEQSSATPPMVMAQLRR